MTTPDIRSVTEAKSQLSAIVDEVNRTQHRVTLTVNGRAAAVVISPQELAAMEETLFWLAQTGTLDDIERASQDQARDELVDENHVRRAFGNPKDA